MASGVKGSLRRRPSWARARCRSTNATRRRSTNPALQDPAERLRTANLPPGADVRGAFKTAEDLFKYISREMPLPRSKAGSLTPDEYWALTNFILLGHGVALPGNGVNPSNAAQVPMKPAE